MSYFEDIPMVFDKYLPVGAKAAVGRFGTFIKGGNGSPLPRS
jgi:hypothetical protein